MANPGLDSVNLEADDVLSQRRQREIKELTQGLARFRPTKVMIEAPYASPAQQRRYEEYVAGTYILTRNEIDQIAFRLAKQAGLSSITPIDFPMMMSGLTYDELEFKPQPQPVAAAPPARPLTDDERRLRDSSVAEFLLYINDEARWRLSHLGYMRNFEPRPDNPAIYEARIGWSIGTNVTSACGPTSFERRSGLRTASCFWLGPAIWPSSEASLRTCPGSVWWSPKRI